MKLHTTRFGEIDVPDEQIIAVPEGILGFPDDKRFVLLEHDSEGTPFKWLQSADSEHLAFIVIDPNLVVEGFEVEWDKESVELLGPVTDEAREDIAMMAIVNVPHDDPIAMTVNLRAPIVVHAGRRLGRQIVLTNEAYPIRHRIFPDQPAEGDETEAPAEQSAPDAD